LRRSTKALSDWTEVFPHATCTVTLVDRLTHRAEIIEIQADSYRLKESKERREAKAKARKAKATHPKHT
jgi:DNA replication protein DnaC